MENKLARLSRIFNHRNGNCEVDNILFVSGFVFLTIESIDINLRLLYTAGSVSSDWESINYSPVRDNEEEFDAILTRVEDLIDRIKDAKYKYGIVDCFHEGLDFGIKTNNNNKFVIRILDIVRKMHNIGIYPFGKGIWIP